MANAPGFTIRDQVKVGDSVLSLCAGIATEIRRLPGDNRVVCVDVVPEYLAEIKRKYPEYETVLSDALKYAVKVPDKSFDVVSCIDGLEHLKKKDGLRLIKEMKRIAKKKILLFTPQGYVRNEPKHTWDIDGGDHYQLHISGWTVEELTGLGFELLWENDAKNPWHGDYKEAMYVYNKL